MAVAGHMIPRSVGGVEGEGWVQASTCDWTLKDNRGVRFGA